MPFWIGNLQNNRRGVVAEGGKVLGIQRGYLGSEFQFSQLKEKLIFKMLWVLDVEKSSP